MIFLKNSAPSIKFIFIGFVLVPISHAHDVFLRPSAYDVKQREEVEVIVFDGDFDKSVYAITTGSVDHLQISNSNGINIADTGSWSAVEKDSPLWVKTKKKEGILSGVDLTHTSSFKFTPDSTGSQVLGLTIYEFRIAFSLEEFIEYLKSEAALEWDMSTYGFTDPKELVRERYTKTAKTIISVGNEISIHATEPMGLVVEIVPLTQPSTAKVGDKLQFRLLEEGEPVANHPVIVGRKDGLDSGLEDDRLVLQSDSQGIVTLHVSKSGIWYMKFIKLAPAPEDDRMDFFSRWASLTFEIQ
ncbi:MAG: DUF4198 domain-containing protein [Verrucomicrobia bacterium]|nr:DUF4198 domain-containing protein [Verrucomicrobiota bacterium]